MKQLTDEVRDAMRTAFNLGQTYWRQADSESVKQQNKSITREDVIRMAKESGFKACVGTTDKAGNYHPFVNALGKDIPIEWLERFAALAALDTAQPEPVNAMLVEALDNYIDDTLDVSEMDEVAHRFAHPLAMELETVLSAYHGTHWDKAMQVLGDYRSAMNRIHERESPTFMGEPVLGGQNDAT